MRPVRSTLISIAAGIGIALLGSWLLGYTAAIPAPQQWFTWFNASLGSYAGLVIWEMLAVQFLGVGLAAALTSFFVVKHAALPWWRTCLFIIAAEILFVFLQTPGGMISLEGLLLLQHAHETVVIVCVLAGGYLAMHYRPDHQPV